MTEFSLRNYLIGNNAVLLNQKAANREDAVRLCVEILERLGAVRPGEYYDGIIENLEKNGPYFVLIPGFAMPHAAPECGVLENAFSLVSLETPVVFGHEDNDPVEVVLCIAAKDRKSLNEDSIVQVMEILEYDGFIERVRSMKNIEELDVLLDEISPGK